MIFFGWGRESLFLLQLQMHPCTRCGTARTFGVYLNYTYFHLFWIFGAVLSKKYIATCGACGQSILLTKEQLPFSPARNPIPFMRRWGLGILLIAVFGIPFLTLSIANLLPTKP